MASLKLTSLETIGSPTTDDLLYIVDGTTTSNKVSVGSLLGVQHDHTASDITDFDTEVANNTAVSANTDKISYTDSAAVALNTAKKSASSLYDYIVAADGSGDYTTINEAWTALGTSRGTVHVKTGDYTLTSQLVFSSGQNLIGDGAGAVRITLDDSMAGTTAIVYDGSGSVTEVTIKGITFFGTGTSSTPITNETGIVIDYMSVCKFIDVAFRNFDYGIVGSTNCYYNDFIAVTVKDCDRGITLNTGANENHFIGGRVQACHVYEADVSANNVSFTSVSIESTTGLVTVSSGGANTSFNNCRFESGSSGSINIESGSYYTHINGGRFVNFTITDNGTDSLVFKNGKIDSNITLSAGKTINCSGITAISSAYMDIIGAGNGVRLFNNANSSVTRPMEFYTNDTSNLDVRRMYIGNYVDTSTVYLDNGTNLDVEGNIVVDGTVDGHDIDSELTTNNAKVSADGSIATHSNVDLTSVAKNDVLMYNGSTFVPVSEGTSFIFSISSFGDNQSSTQLIGSGTWLAIGGISFTASYSNGPPTSSTVQIQSGVTAWSSSLNMGGPNYTGPTVSTEAVPYPASVGTTVRFRLSATDGIDSDTADTTVVFYNYLMYGTTTKTDTYLEADVEGLATQTLTNDNTQTWSAITTGSGEYMLFAFPTRLGIPTFWVGGFEGGFESPETVSVTNSAGFTEDYYVWRSTNSNLGSSSVETK